jgi:hypothetical protein
MCHQDHPLLSTQPTPPSTTPPFTTMKVFLRYEDNDDESTHKTLKITLPKSWISSDVSLLDQFVESYNAGKEGRINPLVLDKLHLALQSSAAAAAAAAAEGDEQLHDLPSDGISYQN